METRSRQGAARSEMLRFFPRPRISTLPPPSTISKHLPFMPNFLDLPREIRDEIYKYSLTSPSGLVSSYLLSRPPTLKSKRRVKAFQRKKPNKQQLHLITLPLNLPPYDPILDKPELFLTQHKSSYITLSLPSTCRQIYNETQGIFWRQNTFYFHTINESGHNIGLTPTLKLMGQNASRLIQTITIRMPSHKNEYTGCRKALKILASRARLGHFNKLELVWEEDAVDDLLEMFLFERLQPFDELLDEFREGFEGVRFERVARVAACPMTSNSNHGLENEKGMYELLTRWIHRAVGGNLICGERVEWVNGVEVGDSGLAQSQT